MSQVYTPEGPAPVPDKVTELPIQILLSSPALILGKGFTNTV